MKHLLLTTIAAVVLVGCGSVFVVHASTQNERSKAKAANVHVASSTFIATVKKDLKYINYTLFVILSLIAFVIYVIYKLDSGRPLREAAEKGNIEAVKQHLAAGTNVDAIMGFDGRTPLLGAVRKGHKEIAELLIANGADVNAKNYERKAPLDFAVKYKRTELVDLLRKHGGKTGEELKAEGK